MEINRKLVTLRSVREIVEIPDADFIELAKIDGWQCVVKKGEFQVGSHCIYFEIDSIVPDWPTFAFLKGHRRIRTMKLRKVLSQGLALPISALNDPNIKLDHDAIVFNEGDDLTEVFEVIKYEPNLPAHLKGKVLSTFPTNLIPKTDQERIQNIKGILERFKEESFVVSEKIDGSSATYFYDFEHQKFGVCSRNMLLDHNSEENVENTYVKIAKEKKIEEVLTKYCTINQCSIALQGELAGPGIQKNRLKLDKIDFYIFDIYNIDAQQYFVHDAMVDIVAELNRLYIIMFDDSKPFRTVPYFFLDYSTNGKTVDDLLELVSTSTSLLSKGKPIEGMVFKLRYFEETQINYYMSFKVINNNYLLAEENEK